MKPWLKRKVILLSLAFCFVLLFVFAETLTIDNYDHDHDCTGPLCYICLKIEMAKSLKLAGITLFFAGCPVFSALIPKIHTWFNNYFLSPIVLRVRSNS